MMAVAAAIAESAMPFRRVVRAYVIETKYETLRMLRAPAFAIPFLLIPLAVYAFFTTISIGGDSSKTPNLPILLFTGFTVMGVMGPGLFGFGVSIALEREQGLLRLKRALPMPPMAYLTAKLLMAALFSGFVSATLILAALVLSPAPLSPSRLAAVFVASVLGTLPFCAIGLFVGARVSGRAAPAFVNLVYLPMIYLSGLFFPLPKALGFVALASPAFHLNQLLLGLAGVGSILLPTMHLAALAGVCALFVGLTVRRLTRAE
jgi:ABC-2 type transport system permease protein